MVQNSKSTKSTKFKKYKKYKKYSEKSPSQLCTQPTSSWTTILLRAAGCNTESQALELP